MSQFKLFLVFVMAIFSVISCNKTAIDSPPNIELRNTSKSATAATVTKITNDIDLAESDWFEFNACTGYNIDVIQGIWRIEQTIIVNGNRITIQSHSNVSNYKLVDQITGIAYTGSYVSNETYNDNIIAGQPANLSGMVKILLTTPGKGANGKYIIDYHVTINANGVATVVFTNFRADCQ